MSVPSPYRTAWPVNAPKEPTDLRAVLDDIEARLDSAAIGGGNSFGLNFDGEVDNRAVLEDAIAAEIAAGRDHMIVSPPTGTASPTIYFDGIVRIRNYDRPFTFEIRGLAMRYGPNAELRSDGDDLELPETGKGKLWANVDATGGNVVAFDIDVRPNPAIVALLVAGARIRVRGQNNAVGEVIDGYKHETTVVSLVEVVEDERYTLTISTALPTTVPSNVWKRDWDGSEWTADVGGPSVDSTLISVLNEMPLDEEVSDTADIPVPDGFDAESAFPVGSWVVAQCEARTQDLVEGGGSNEFVTRQMAQVSGHSTGFVHLDRPIDGTLYLTISATDMRPRLTRMKPPIEPTIRFDPSFPVQVIGTVAAPPASRRHIIQHRYAVRPRTYDVRLHGDDNTSDVHGALVREHVCVDGYGERLIRTGAKHRATGGSANGIWLKGSSRSRYHNCLMVRCRHGFTPGSGSSCSITSSVFADCWESAIDTGHGEGGHYHSAIDNHVFGGMAADDRSDIKGIESSNNSALFGDDGSVIHGNHFYNFGQAGASAIILRSGSRGTQIIDNVIHGDCETAVSIKVDRRAPQQGISGITIRGHFADGVVAIDGRPPGWVSGAEILGTAARPTFLEDDTRTRLYSTEDSGNLGVTNPTHTSGSAANGDVDLTYVGLVAEQGVPIDGVRIEANVTVTEFRADNVVIAGEGSGGTAAGTSYDNNTSGLTADDVQEAIDELAASVAADEIQNWTGDGEETLIEATLALAAAVDSTGALTVVVDSTDYSSTPLQAANGELRFLTGNFANQIVFETGLAANARGEFDNGSGAAMVLKAASGVTLNGVSEGEVALIGRASWVRKAENAIIVIGAIAAPVLIRGPVSGQQGLKFNNLTGAQTLSPFTPPSTGFPSGAELFHSGAAATYTVPSRVTTTGITERLVIFNRGSGDITLSASGPTLQTSATIIPPNGTAVLTWEYDGTTEKVWTTGAEEPA